MTPAPATTPTARALARLVTRGDDAGGSASANRAIRHCFEHGVLRNASVMAPGPALGDAAARLAGLDGLCVGMHATLTSEWDTPCWGPVADPARVASLREPDGGFPRDLDRLRGRADPEHVALELAAQLDRLRRTGFRVAYLDEHMGVGEVDGVRDRLRELARREGLVYRPDLDRRRVAIPTPPTDPGYLDAAAQAVRGLGAGNHLLVGHPCFDDAETRAVRPHGAGLAAARAAQRELFCDARVVDALRASAATPTRYTEL